MADTEPIPVIATHVHQRTLVVPAGTPGEITAMKGTYPTDYTVSVHLNGSNELVTVDHVRRMDIHEA